MTIKIEVECDSLSCFNSADIDEMDNASIEHAGYHTDPDFSEYHYCSRCWPKVKEEVKKRK